MRTLIAFLLLSLAGCGGPVTEAEFRSFLGRPAGDLVRRMGKPDRDEALTLEWRGKVVGADGRKRRHAAAQYSGESGRVWDVSVSAD
jgi:hypothetical protein